MKKGVTFMELIVVIAILGILAAIAVPAFVFFQKGSTLDNNAEQIINLLSLTQSKTLASENSGQYGVYFNTGVSPNQYVLFKGANFVPGDSANKVYTLSSELEFYDINLGGLGLNEVVFEKLTGLVEQPGSVSLRLISDFSKTKTIYVEGSGQAGFSGPNLPAAGRIEDWRHVHINYGHRDISLATSEKVVLDFGGALTKEINIVDFLQGGNFYWEGEIDVAGEKQILKIHTHRLNNPDTQWCIHRDRRYNNKALTVYISGDPGFLADYSADGLTFSSQSINVDSYEKQ